MVREASAPLIILSGYMQPAALGGALNTPEADGEESQHLQLQPSLKDIPSSVRGGFTACQFLHSLCCCSFCYAKCFGLHCYSVFMISLNFMLDSLFVLCVHLLIVMTSTRGEIQGHVEMMISTLFLGFAVCLLVFLLLPVLMTDYLFCVCLCETPV